jgi:hypothetical protein
MGPTRAELRAEMELWKARCDRHSMQTREAYARAKASEKEERRLRQELARAHREAKHAEAYAIRVIDQLHDRLNEPPRKEGCLKIRFHREPEAQAYAAHIASTTGEPAEAYEAYRCKSCPRSPVTMQPYYHIGHRMTEEGRRAREAGRSRQGKRRALALRDGRTVEQLVAPETLRKMIERVDPDAGHRSAREIRR